MTDRTLKRAILGAFAAAFVLLSMAHCARADDCTEWASFVEQLEQMDEKAQERAVHHMHQLGHQHQMWYRRAMRAFMWIRAGQTSEAAWRQCESY